MALLIALSSFSKAWMQLKEQATEVVKGSYKHLSRRYELRAACLRTSAIILGSEILFRLFLLTKSTRHSTEAFAISLELF